MKISKVHNLDTLEKEIYRQRLELKSASKQLEEEIDYLRKNLFRLTKNSMMGNKDNERKEHSFIEKLFNYKPVQETVSGLADRITTKVGGAIDSFIERVLQKKSKNG